ncbi:MAG: hypothetical protein KAH20_17190 [Methylococcales bacterium]|nr:hypothetical protein [Methylococcales bacterium]
MHDYSIDNHPKEKILFFLALIAITVTPFINNLSKTILDYAEATAGWSSIPVTVIPVFAIFGGLYWLFNKYLWRISFLRKFLLVPDFNGEWVVEGKTTLKEGKEADFIWSGEITITQSWSKIYIYIKTKQSSSKSVSASIHIDEGVGYKVLYQYENIPNADELELLKHSGSAELLFDLSCLSAKGHYYTDRHRNTVGILELRKKENEPT